MFNILVFPKWVLDIEFHLSIKIKFFYEEIIWLRPYKSPVNKRCRKVLLLLITASFQTTDKVSMESIKIL